MAAGEPGAGALRQADALDLLRLVLDDATIGFALIDTDLRFVLVNPVLAAVNGVPVADHVGRHVTEVLPGLDHGVVDVLQHVLDTGEPLRDVEVSGRTLASAEYHTWLEDFYRVQGPDGRVAGVVAVLADVTAQRRSERRVAQILDSLGSFVGLCLPDGTLVEANRRALDAAGIDRADVVGRPFWETYWWTWHPDVAARLREAFAEAVAGTPVRYDADVRVAGGLITIDFQLVPVVEDGEVVAVVPSATDVTARRRSVEQALALAALARRLNASATVRDVVREVLDAAAAVLGGRYTTVALVTPAGDAVELHQTDSLDSDLRSRYRVLSLDAPVHICRAIRENRTVALVDPVRAEDVGGDEASAEQLRADRAAAGVAASSAVPFVGADGVPFGALGMGWATAAEYDDHEVRARLATVAELCGQAFDRARLADAQVVASGRSAALSTLAADLASAGTLDQVHRAVAERTPPVVGASSARLTAGDGPVRDPAPEAAGGAVAVPAVRLLPLRDNQDVVIGALEVRWQVPTVLGPVLRDTLDTVAELVGQTLERARLHAAEHELVEGLQRRLLRPLPSPPGLDVHGSYRSAQTDVGIGGDFYDGLELPDGRLVVVVGDVSGHGVEAAADMAQLRTATFTLVAAGVGLAELFPRADAVLGRVADLSLATAAAAIVDPRAGTVTYVHAGHPPWVLRTPDGIVRVLEGGRGPLLGVGAEHAQPDVVGFPPGSVLVGYTDGLVEDRDEDLDHGIERLVTTLAASTADGVPPAGVLTGRLLEGCLTGRRREDDVALVVVCRAPDAAAPGVGQLSVGASD